MSIAAVVSEALRQSGMSQMELAHSIGVTQSYISQICSGRKIPTLGKLARIGDCLGIPMERFVGNGSIQAGKDEWDGLILSEDEIHMLRRYREMSEHDQKLVYAMVNRIAGNSARDARTNDLI